jgi:P27 family predicted phage terminase small subunit
MRGRPKLSDDEKKRRGTFQKCRSNENTPVPGSSNLEPTQVLDYYAKKVWKRTMKFLDENTLAGDVDSDLLTVYCIEMSKYFQYNKSMKQFARDREKLRKEMEADGRSIFDITQALNFLPSPYSLDKLSKESFDRSIKISDRYGFSPVARQRLKVEKKKEIKDPLMALMSAAQNSSKNAQA